CHQYSSYPLTF
nr:immunoglobulin light chain junction region [Mus musculus]